MGNREYDRWRGKNIEPGKRNSENGKVENIDTRPNGGKRPLEKKKTRQATGEQNAGEIITQRQERQKKAEEERAQKQKRREAHEKNTDKLLKQEEGQRRKGKWGNQHGEIKKTEKRKEKDDQKTKKLHTQGNKWIGQERAL